MLERSGRVGLTVAVVAVFLVLMVAAIYFARDAGVQIGHAATVAAENQRLKDSLDLAQVEALDAKYRIQTLEQTVEQAKGQMEYMIPVWDAVWCEGMEATVLEQKAALVLKTVEYIKAVTKAEGASLNPQICVITMGIIRSSVRDEIYVLASRAFQGGEPEMLYVYWGSDPANPDQYIIVGHYDVGERKLVTK